MSRAPQILFIRYRERKAEAGHARDRDGVHRHLYASPPPLHHDPNFTEHVLEVDLDELFMHGTDRYELADNRMAYWTEQRLQLKPDAPLPSIEWQQLTKDDVETLARVFGAWQRRRERNYSDGLLDLVEAELAHILGRVVDKLGAPR